MSFGHYWVDGGNSIMSKDYIYHDEKKELLKEVAKMDGKCCLDWHTMWGKCQLVRDCHTYYPSMSDWKNWGEADRVCPAGLQKWEEETRKKSVWEKLKEKVKKALPGGRRLNTSKPSAKCGVLGKCMFGFKLSGVQCKEDDCYGCDTAFGCAYCNPGLYALRTWGGSWYCADADQKAKCCAQTGWGSCVQGC